MGIFGFFKKDKPPKRAAIIDVNDADFKKYVIRRSHKTPVLVDFWAAWCGPCRQLSPVLEKIAEEPDQTFILAKLNTEHNQRAAAAYNIHSIPAVKAFRNGQIVEEFTGVLPETLVRRFIEKVSSQPAPAPKLTMSGNPAKRLKQGRAHLKRSRGFEAYVTLNDFPESSQAEEAEELLPLADFLFDVEDDHIMTGVDELDEAYLDAGKAFKRGKPELALDNLFTALEVGEDIDESRTTAIIEAAFALLGESNKITQDYRGRLAAS